MIEVWLAGGVVALLAVALVVMGARRRPRTPADGIAAAALFSDRRREIEVEARVLGVGDDDIVALQEELALELIDSTGDPSAAAEAHAGRPPLLPLLVGAVVCALVALGLYGLWGEPDAPVLATATDLMVAEEGSPEALADLERALLGRLERKPDDADGWFHLGHLRMRTSDHGGAADAFASLHELTGGNEQIDSAWAQASFLAAGGTVDAATREVVERVFAVRPEHPHMLELLAMDAIRRTSFVDAAGFLDRALRQSLPNDRRMLLEETLALTRMRLDAARAFIEVTVEVSGSPPPWLTVFARPVSGSMPLAVVRRPALAQQTLTLDDAVSMNPELPLSAGGPVEVVARLSQTGAATDRDAEAVSEPVDPATQPRVHLTVALPGEAPVGIIVDVSLAAVVDAAVPVFVIARHPSMPGPPVAVRRLTAGALPARVVLTDADAMMPGRKLTALEEVEVLARASLSGSPTAQPGDLESAAVTTRLGASEIALRIERRLR